MKILSIKLNNFRQFYGTTPKITFSHGDKNVTVVHGENGAGKTTLLNAFTWALFDTTTQGFENPKDIVNRRAIREAAIGTDVEAWVEIEFMHQELRHVVKRSAKATRKDAVPEWDNHEAQKPELLRADQNGKWNLVEEYYDAIGRILPQDLHTYFFFDGERIERIVQPTDTQKEETGKAAKKLLGVEIFTRAEDHLNKAKRELEKELKKYGDAETAELLEQKLVYEKDLQKLVDRQEEIARNIAAHKRRGEDIEAKLRKDKESQAIQERRDSLKKQRDDRDESFKGVTKALADVLSKQAYIIFSEETMNHFEALINDLREKGEIPTGIKRYFVEALLRENKCICNTELNLGSEGRQAVEDWRNKAGLADVEEKAIKMGGEISQLRIQVPQLLTRLDELQQNRSLDHQELSRIEDELDKISEALKKNPPREDLKTLQLELDQSEEAIEDLLKEHGGNDIRIKDLKGNIEELEDNIEKKKSTEEKQDLASRRVKAAKDAAQRIAQIRELMEDDFRKNLQDKIARLFRTISPTPYLPHVGTDYSLSLYESTGGAQASVGKSTGESQILSLSFIGSIIELVREKQKGAMLPGPDTSSYPIVMDSPFGTLSMYRHLIAEHMPKLADQIALLVSPKQWQGDVESSIAPKLGKSYVLTYFTPRHDIKPIHISLNGKKWDLVKSSPNEYEYTTIQEVS